MITQKILAVAFDFWGLPWFKTLTIPERGLLIKLHHAYNKDPSRKTARKIAQFHNERGNDKEAEEWNSKHDS